MKAERTHTSVRRAGDALCALGFALLIALVPCVGFFRAAPAASVEREFRRPAPDPQPIRDLASLIAWPAAFDAWYRDHFGLRPTFIRWHNRAKLELFDVSPSSEIVLGPGGWMFTTRDRAVDVFRGADPLSERELELWAQILSDRREWCAQRGIAYVFALAPNKETVYPEQFPARFDAVGPTRREQLVERARGRAGLPLLDLTDALRRAKAEFGPQRAVYFPLGTHWNERGALYAADALVRRVAELAPRVAPRALSEFAFRPTDYQDDSWAGRLYVDDLYRQQNDEAVFARRIPAAAWERLRLFSERKDRTPQESALFEIAPQAGEPAGWRIRVRDGRHVSTEVDGLDTPRVVVFHDSMGEKLRPFLAEVFGQVAFRWLPDFDADFIERERPDVVLQVAVERQLAAVALSTSPLDTQERLAREFDASRAVLLAPADALRGLVAQPLGATALAPAADGALEVQYGGGGLLVPEFSAPAGTWPVLRVELDAPRESSLLVEFLTGRFGDYSRQARGVQRPLQAGRNVVLVKLRVPALAGRLRLHPGVDAGQYRLRSLEVRAVPE